MSRGDPRPTDADDPGRAQPGPSDLKLVEDVFFKVAPLAPADREEAIRHLCDGSPTLESEVRSLLESAARVGVFLERPALGKDVEQLTTESRSREPPDELIGSIIGAFRIERRIAAGGMGTVYVGARSDGRFDQKVAVKVVKRGMDSEEILARFRSEIQALAALDHPNIARLIDGGVTPDGRPYLAMEFVDGAPVDQFCDERALKVRERIALFQRVCEAVHHAHQNLVIHRDIKPSNILVTPQGVPKLLDFGIAKLLKGGDTQPALTAETDRRLTPEYASPEQVEGRPVSTASDIYALGVVLYELLAGVRPYTFAVRTQEEVRRVVCDLIPPPPSAAVTVRASRLGTSVKTPHPSDAPTTPGRADTAQRDTGADGRAADAPRTRGVTSTRLRSVLRGDIDNIVMYALRKEPQRRYASADQLSADLGRYLDGMPVLARRDTLSYRASKFIRRHRVGVALVFGALVIHGALTAMLYEQGLRLTRQRDELTASNRSLEATRTYLTNILEAGGSGVGSLGPDVPLGVVVQESARALRDTPPDDPLTRAAAEQALGRTCMSLGMLAEARDFLEQAEIGFAALAPEADALVDTRIALAELLFHERKPAEAEARFREILKQELGVSGGAPTARAGLLLNNIGACLRANNQAEQAIATQREALAVRTAVHGARSLEAAETSNNLGSALIQGGDVDGAIEQFDASLAIRSSLLRPDHPLVVRALSNLGLAQLRNGMVDDAEANLRRGADLWGSAFGAAHPGRVGVSISHAQALVKQQRFDEAIERLRGAIDWQREHLAPGAAAIAATEAHVGITLEASGRPDEAREILARVVPRLEAEGAAFAGVLGAAKESLERLNQPGR